MQLLKKAGLSVFVSLLVLFSASETSFPALSADSRKIIQIAYMNGYVAALKEDMERIRSLKQDPDLMRHVVEQAAANYVQRVYEMNLKP